MPNMIFYVCLQLFLKSLPSLYSMLTKLDWNKYENLIHFLLSHSLGSKYYYSVFGMCKVIRKTDSHQFQVGLKQKFMWIYKLILPFWGKSKLMSKENQAITERSQQSTKTETKRNDYLATKRVVASILKFHKFNNAQLVLPCFYKFLHLYRNYISSSFLQKPV